MILKRSGEPYARLLANGVAADAVCENSHLAFQWLEALLHANNTYLLDRTNLARAFNMANQVLHVSSIELNAAVGVASVGAEPAITARLACNHALLTSSALHSFAFI